LLSRKPDNTDTFGDLADTYIRAAMNASYKYQQIDVVFDRYREETIKAATRK